MAAYVQDLLDNAKVAAREKDITALQNIIGALAEYLSREDLQVLNYDEVARSLQITPRTLRSWVAANKIPYVKLCNRFVRFRKTEVEQWLKKQKGMR